MSWWERLQEWLLDRVPYFARSWPWLRQFYWQQEDIDRAETEAEEIMEKMRWE